MPASELFREQGISIASFYEWRVKYGSMDTSLISRTKELDLDNARLKKMYAKEQLQADALKEA